jgi:CelD/BcsL family acetyltransferase involved in cellulose biosynthesis
MDVNSPDSQIAPVLLDPSDERWVAFATSKPEASIFHHPAWMNLLHECYGYRPFVIAVCNTDGGVSAGLPMMEVNSWLTGRRWVSLPFSDYCAPLYDDDKALNQLTGALASLYRDGNVPRIEVRWGLPAHPDIHSSSNYVLHTVKLAPDVDLVVKGFKRTHRQNIRTAEKRGVCIEWGNQPEDLRLFYRLHLETRRRHGVPVQPWQFFELLGKKVLEQGLGFLLLAYGNDQCLAAGLFLHWQRTLTYKYAASSDGSQIYRPNNLLTWEAMRWGCENGYTQFDLGRADFGNAGLRRFKRGWGAEESPLTYSTLSAKPPRSTDGRLMNIMQAAILKSPVWVCRAAGELLYGHFG